MTTEHRSGLTPLESTLVTTGVVIAGIALLAAFARRHPAAAQLVLEALKPKEEPCSLKSVLPK